MNGADAKHSIIELATLGATAVAFLMALDIPEAFADGRGRRHRRDGQHLKLQMSDMVRLTRDLALHLLDPAGTLRVYTDEQRFATRPPHWLH